MPNLTYQQIKSICEESHRALSGGCIQKIHQPQKEFLLFYIRKPQITYRLFFCLQQQNIAFFLTKNSWTNPSTPLFLCQLLRKHLLNAYVRKIEVLDNDRSVILTMQNQERFYFLRFELWGRNGNVYLLDHNKIILGTLYPSTKPKDYFQMVVQTETSVATTPKKNFLDQYYKEELRYPWNNAADIFFYEHINKVQLERKTQKLVSLISREKKKVENKLKKLRISVEESKNNEDIRILGELLKSNLQKIKRGTKEIEVINYYSQDGSTPILIPLDPRKSATQNMQGYFKKYRKLEDAKPFLEKQIEKATVEQKKYEKWLRKLNEGEIPQDLPKKWLPQTSKPNAKKDQKDRDCYRKFISQDDFVILVGRGSRDNDELTFRVAKGNDLWMHTEDYPGAHVVIRIGEKKNIPYRTITDAAQLAIYYSKAKEHSKVSIAYTEKKHVSKPKKSKPGLVYISNKKTLTLAPDRELVKKLLSV